MNTRDENKPDNSDSANDPEYIKKHIKIFTAQGFAYQAVEEIISKQMNHTKNWKCMAGMRNLYIDYDGNVFVCNNSSSKLDRFNHEGWGEEIARIEQKDGIRIDTKENIENGTFGKYLKKYNLKTGSFEKVLDSNNPEHRKDHWGFLGNISQGFEINDKVLTCPYETCGCGADIPIAKAKNLATLNQITNDDIVDDMRQLKNSSITAVDGMYTHEYPSATILWDLGRRCNYDCSYCWPGVHNAREPHKSISVLVKTCEKIIEMLSPGERKLFCFSGGEPTLHPEILKLLTVIKLHKQEVLITSNGSMKTEKWKNLVTKIDRLQLSAHFEFINKDRFVDNLKVFLEEQLRVLNLNGKIKSMDVKLMTPPGGIENSRDFRQRIIKIMNDQKYKVLRDKNIIGVSNVPLRGIDDSEKMLDYTDDELKFFINS